MADETLIELCRQVRRDTIRVLESAESDWGLFAPPGTANHMIWHAGHAVWLQDVLCLQLLGCASELPNEWGTQYGMNCRPVAEVSDWPSPEEMLQLLVRQQRRLEEEISAASDSAIDRIADPERGPLTVRSRIIHGFHDEAKHAGEMYLLLKLCRLAGKQ